MEDRFRFRYWHKPTQKMQTMAHRNYLQIIHSDCYEVMQCTGLRDCTGKLIYEGDVVKIISDEDIELLDTEAKPIIRCYYDAEKMCFYGEVINKECLIHKYYAFKIDYLYLWLGSCKIEIIGNIYENPELLEVGR